MNGFKTVAFDFGKIHVRGGHMAKAMPMTSKAISVSAEKSVTFIKMATSEPWLMAVTTGQRKYSSSSFGRTSLLDDLREKVALACDGELETSSSTEEKDPMMDVAQDEESKPAEQQKTRGRGVKRARYYKNHSRKRCVSIDWPTRCPEEDPSCGEHRKITLYIEDRLQVWLALDDVEWAVRYLYVQNMLKGVPLISEDSTGPVVAP